MKWLLVLLLPLSLQAMSDESSLNFSHELNTLLARQKRERKSLNKKMRMYSEIKLATAVVLTVAVVAGKKYLERYFTDDRIPTKSLALLDGLAGLIINNATSVLTYTGLGITALVIYKKINSFLHTKCRINETRLKEQHTDELSRISALIEAYEKRINEQIEVHKKEADHWKEEIEKVEREWYDKLDVFVSIAKKDFKKLIGEFNTNREKLLLEIRDNMKIDTKGFETKLEHFQALVEEAVKTRRELYQQVQHDWSDIMVSVKELQASNVTIKDAISPIMENMEKIMEQLSNFLRRLSQLERERGDVSA